MQWCNCNSAMSRMPKLYYCTSSHQGVSVFLAAYMSCVYLDCEAVLIGEEQDVKTASGADYGEISLGCRLPCLVFEDGNVITQEPVILEYVADKVLSITLCFTVRYVQFNQNFCTVGCG